MRGWGELLRSWTPQMVLCKATGDHSCRRSDSLCLALRRVARSLQQTLITRDTVYDHSLSMLILFEASGWPSTDGAIV